MTLIQELREQLERVVRDKHLGLYHLHSQYDLSADYECAVERIRNKYKHPLSQEQRIEILTKAIRFVVTGDSK